jgi:bisphosphoglycerate-dependent phosphoglycerate mutase
MSTILSDRSYDTPPNDVGASDAVHNPSLMDKYKNMAGARDVRAESLKVITRSRSCHAHAVLMQ